MPNTPEEKKKADTKKGMVNNNIKDWLSSIGDSIVSDIMLNLLMFIPRMIGKLLKVIFS
ncbi:hypothetical protein [Rummeliibacillus pycnus]|uniref:hypothetical protein n=1 Tax=Rummeliibacillus pycnus TaxID=101070 RepID=UPI0014748862|nr:hypothetical protein [Rummeliibacillus pycnus]